MHSVLSVKPIHSLVKVVRKCMSCFSHAALIKKNYLKF